MSGTNTTSSGTPISDLPLASSVAATDTLLGIVGGGSATGGDAHQVSVGVLGSAISEAAGIPGAVTSASQAAVQADAAAQKAYTAGTQAVQDQAGVAGGVAQLDKQAQLYLQGQSALAVTPATSATNDEAATPAMLRPLLPLHPGTSVGGGGTSLGDAVNMAAGAVQADGGNASVAVAIPSGGTTSRTIAALTGSHLGIQDFVGDTQTAQLVAAENALGPADRPIQYIAPATQIIADGTQSVIDANQTVLSGENCTITGAGRRAVHSEILSPPQMFESNVKPRHLTQFYKACRSGSATVIVIGDSIYSPGGSLATMSESPFFTACSEIMRQNPGVNFTFWNMAIGGQNYGGMISTGDVTTQMPWNDIPAGKTWLEACGDLNPDLVFVHSGGNDGWGLLPTQFNTVHSYFTGLTKIPSLVYGIAYQPSLTSSTNTYNTDDTQRGMYWAATYVRSQCIANDYAYIDELRWQSMCRDGIDPLDLSLTFVALDGTTAPATWGAAVSTKSGWSFPPLANDNGVSADACTDWRLGGTFPASGTLPGMITVDLSFNGHGQLWIMFDSSRNITAKYTDGTTAWTIPCTGVKAQTGDLQFALTLKNNRLQLLVLPAKANTDWKFNDIGDKQLSLGYETVFDTQIVNYSVPYTPKITTDTDSQMLVDGLWVASSWQITESCRRYRPITTNNALYKQTDAAGGSDAYHMNTYGVRMLLTPLWRAVNWSYQDAYVANTLDVSDVALIGDFAFGQQKLQRKGVSYSTGTQGNVSADFTVIDGGTFQINWNARLMSGAVNPDVGNNGLIMQVGADGSMVWGSSITAFGGVGMYGTNAPKTQPKITGTKSTDPIVQQILAVIVGCGIASDGTTSS